MGFWFPGPNDWILHEQHDPRFRIDIAEVRPGKWIYRAELLPSEQRWYYPDDLSRTSAGAAEAGVAAARKLIANRKRRLNKRATLH